MAITQNTYTGDGSTVLFSFTFPYLETTDIKVSLDGSITTAYSLANATTIQFDVAPANGVSIEIYRQTDDTDLSATFYPGSAIRSQDLNDNFTQNLYVTQEANREAAEAVTISNAATATANTALSNSAAAVSTSNTALSNSASAVSTANQAASDAAQAVATSNTANTNSTAAVNTSNSAAADAATALSTATSAAADAATALSTANSALADSATALTDSAQALSTANTASTNATTAVNTANTASSNASTAVTTANAADSKADQAIAAVANALLFDIVANVAAIPGSPSDGDAVEVTDSTGIESFTPLANIPVGFVGDSGLGVRIIYDGTNTTWNWLQYFPQDPDNRYAGPNTAAGTVSAPSIAFGPTDTNTGIYSPGADELALVTGGNVRVMVDSAGTVTIPSLLLNNVQLPSGTGTAGQLLSTDGSGNLSWASDVGVLVTDGGNFDNGTSTVSTSQTLDGGQF